MCKFLAKVIIFTIPICLVMGYFEYKLQDVQNSYNSRKSLLDAQTDELRVVVLGSSQTAFGVNPAQFGTASFNMAMSSQDIFYSSRLLLSYLDEMPKLDLALVEIAYFAMEVTLDEVPEYWRQFFYHRYYNLPLQRESLRYDPRNISLFALYGNQTSFDYARRGFNVKSGEKLNAYGWSPYEMQNQHFSEIDGRRRAEFHHEVMRESNRSHNMRELEALLSELRERGISYALFTPPVTQFYSQSIEPAKYQDIQQRMARLREVYGAPYYNYFDDARFDLTHFADYDHLNPAGAKRFSDLLRDEVVSRYS